MDFGNQKMTDVVKPTIRNSGHSNTLKARVFVGLTTTFSQQTEVCDSTTNVRVICSQHAGSLAVFCFCDRKYRYKSETTSIPQEAGLDLTGRKLLSHLG